MKSDSYRRFIRCDQYKELLKAPANKQKSPLPSKPLHNLARIAGKTWRQEHAAERFVYEYDLQFINLQSMDLLKFISVAGALFLCLG